MTADDRIWIGQDGQQFGPYSEADIRQWMREGRLSADALAWREGMTDWATLASLFVTTPSGTPPPPPPPAGMPPLAGGVPRACNDVIPGPFGSADRATLPAPPSLHWGLVLLFAILTFGIFGIVWPFIQASWVRKVDPRSNALLLLGLSLGCFVIGETLYIAGLFSAMRAGQPDTTLVSLGGMLLLGRWVLSLVAYFSMAASVERCVAARGTRLKVGGVTLFFFTMYYLQANLSWVARWKDTGQTSPKPSKAVFWLIFLLIPFVLGAMLAAVAIPAYQSYVVRTQVAQGMTLAEGAKTAVAKYYDAHHMLPTNNSSVGLADATSISGRYVSSVDVDDGVVSVLFDTPEANRGIRYEKLVFLPVIVNDTKVDWNCSTNTTLPERDLPAVCRR